MTIKELKEKLNQFDETADVVLEIENYYYCDYCNIETQNSEEYNIKKVTLDNTFNKVYLSVY